VDDAKGENVECPLVIVAPTGSGGRILLDVELGLPTNRGKELRNGDALEGAARTLEPNEVKDLKALMEWHEKLSRPIWEKWQRDRAEERKKYNHGTRTGNPRPTGEFGAPGHVRTGGNSPESIGNDGSRWARLVRRLPRDRENNFGKSDCSVGRGNGVPAYSVYSGSITLGYSRGEYSRSSNSDVQLSSGAGDYGYLVG